MICPDKVITIKRDFVTFIIELWTFLQVDFKMDFLQDDGKHTKTLHVF